MGADGVTLSADAFKMYLPSWSLKGSLRAFKNHSRDSEEKGEENKIHGVRFLLSVCQKSEGLVKTRWCMVPRRKKKKYQALGEKKKKELPVINIHIYTCVCAHAYLFI